MSDQQPKRQRPQILPTTVRQTSARDFAKRVTEGEWMLLPYTGRPARLSRPGLVSMAALGGGIPNPISRQAIDILREGTRIPYGATDEQQQKAFDKQSEAYIEMGAVIMLEPKIVFGYDCRHCGKHVHQLKPPTRQEFCDLAPAPELPELPEGAPRPEQLRGFHEWERTMPDLDAGEIAPEMVADLDYILMYNWAQAVPSEMATFPDHGVAGAGVEPQPSPASPDGRPAS